MAFPKDFMWAVASSHYQIEGGGTKGGRGLSTWDAIRRETGRIRGGSDPEEDIGGYEKWKEDIQLVKDLGVSHYRFSISWSRLLPKGTLEEINEEGIQYYKRLLEEVIRQGLTPVVTLFHFDWPLCLFDQGGWRNPLSPQWFAAFSDLCFRHYGHLVPIWITFNEIGFHVLSAICKLEGEPFHCPTRPPPEEGDAAPLVAAHNMLLAHGQVYRNYERNYKEKFKGQVGIVTGGAGWCVPLTEGDRETAERAIDFNLGWTLDPVIFGDYPLSMKSRLNGEDGLPKLPAFTEEEQKMLKGSTDFVGINYYLPRLVGKGTGGTLLERFGEYKLMEDSWERISGDHWCRNYPQGLLDMFRIVRDKYGNLPVMVTENGCADLPGDPLDDHNRVKFITDHVQVTEKAIAEKCNIVGYTVWCLADNFEWDDGFGVKFGMYRVECTGSDKKRTAKKSAAFYRNLIAKNT